MMDHNLSLFPDLALAEDQLDASSWLFQDDLYQEQGFCRVAKDVHSLPSITAGYPSPPFITSQDLPVWMENSDSNINWDQPFSIEDCFPHDLKKQHQPSLNEPYSDVVTDHLSNQQVAQKIKNEKPEHISEQLVQQAYLNQIFKRESDVSFPQLYDTPDNGCPEYIFDTEDQFDEDIGTANCVTSPCIISVPLSDAVNDQDISINKINISSIQVLGNQQNSFIETSNQHCRPVTTASLNQQQNPQKVVINLKRVSLPSKKFLKTEPVIIASETAGPTLKEVLTSGYGDDLMLQLVGQSSELQESIDETSSITVSSSDLDDASFMSDSGSSSEEGSCSSLMSPASSNDYSNDLFPESPATSVSEESIQSSVRLARYSPFSPTEKKLRKKEQNKRAALRYRQKRKGEEESVMTVLQKEEERQKILQTQYDALSLEVKFIKKLMREVITKKR